MAGIGVEIGAEQPRTLPADQFAAVGGLADRLITGREIRHHRGPCQRMGAAWRDGCPQILAHLGGQHKGGHLLTGEQQVRTNQRFLPGQLDTLRLTHTGDEVALLVKFAIVGQVHFWHKAQQFTVAEYCRAVVELAVVAYRQPDEDNEVQPFAGFQNRGKAVLGPAQERFLQEQIAAGVAGQCKLRQTEQLDVFFGVFAHDADDLVGVVGAIGHAQGGAGCGGTDESIFKSGKAVLHSQTSFIII